MRRKAPRNQHTEAHRQQRSFAMHCVDYRSRWSLHRDRDQAAKSQGITHTARIPSTRSQIGGQEWAKACLYVGEKKVQPFERLQTPLFSLRDMAHRISLRFRFESCEIDRTPSRKRFSNSTLGLE